MNGNQANYLLKCAFRLGPGPSFGTKPAAKRRGKDTSRIDSVRKHNRQQIANTYGPQSYVRNFKGGLKEIAEGFPNLFSSK